MLAPASHGRDQPSRRNYLTRPSPARAWRIFSEQSCPLSVRAERTCFFCIAGAANLDGQFVVRRRESQPFKSDVMHVREECRDRPRSSTRRLCFPGASIEMLQNKLVQVFIDRKSLKKQIGEIRGRRRRLARHGTSSRNGYGN